MVSLPVLGQGITPTGRFDSAVVRTRPIAVERSRAKPPFHKRTEAGGSGLSTLLKAEGGSAAPIRENGSHADSDLIEHTDDGTRVLDVPESFMCSTDRDNL